ncbi:MAG TPA: terminase, partial [Balneola sp.]|nr:terminase [Balneola sp.]
MGRLSKQKQVSEIVKCGKDPAYFFNKYLKIQHPVRGLIPFDTYDFQDECVEDFINHRFNIVLKSRQLGLSTLVAAYSVWMAIFQREKNILIIATKLSVAQNFITKVKTMIKSLPPWLMLPEIVANNKQQIQFNHGSSIKAIPTSE